MLLHIDNHTASVDGPAILQGLDHEIGTAEVHSPMGPNGAGKTTLSGCLTGPDGS